jgi:hypothetical protein
VATDAFIFQSDMLRVLVGHTANSELGRAAIPLPYRWCSMRRLVIGVVLLAGSPAVAGEDALLVPLDRYAAGNTGWETAATHVAYMSARCAAAFLTVGAYANGAGLPGATELTETGATFALASARTARAAGAADRFTLDRIKSLSRVYGERVKVSKQLHNEAFDPDLRKDITFCKAQANALLGF